MSDAAAGAAAGTADPAAAEITTTLSLFRNKDRLGAAHYSEEEGYVSPALASRSLPDVGAVAVHEFTRPTARPSRRLAMLTMPLA